MRKTILFCCGWLALVLGAIGAVLPLLPTTPFVILAALCFSKSSERFHQMLVNHRLFGPMIRDWEAHGIIPFKIKCLSSSMMLLMVSYPVFFKPLPLWVDVSAVSLVLVALTYVWSRPSVVEQKDSDPI